jgi:DNA-binding MarR family transcriptional regulator
MHAFALQALGPDGTSASELARRLAVTKQAAAKHVHTLERLGYVEVVADPRDARSRVVRPTSRGIDLIAASARMLDTLKARWTDQLGPDRLGQLLADLKTLAASDALRTDVLGWLGAPVE